MGRFSGYPTRNTKKEDSQKQDTYTKTPSGSRHKCVLITTLTGPGRWKFIKVEIPGNERSNDEHHNYKLVYYDLLQALELYLLTQRGCITLTPPGSQQK